MRLFPGVYVLPNIKYVAQVCGRKSPICPNESLAEFLDRTMGHRVRLTTTAWTTQRLGFHNTGWDVMGHSPRRAVCGVRVSSHRLSCLIDEHLHSIYAVFGLWAQFGEKRVIRKLVDHNVVLIIMRLGQTPPSFSSVLLSKG